MLGPVSNNAVANASALVLEPQLDRERAGRVKRSVIRDTHEIGSASCRERVCFSCDAVNTFRSRMAHECWIVMISGNVRGRTRIRRLTGFKFTITDCVGV